MPGEVREAIVFVEEPGPAGTGVLGDDGEDIFAEGRVLKRGKEIIYSDVRVTNAAGKLLAQGTVTYRIVERAEGESALPGSKGGAQ